MSAEYNPSEEGIIDAIYAKLNKLKTDPTLPSWTDEQRFAHRIVNNGRDFDHNLKLGEKDLKMFRLSFIATILLFIAQIPPESPALDPAFYLLLKVFLSVSLLVGGIELRQTIHHKNERQRLLKVISDDLSKIPGLFSYRPTLIEALLAVEATRRVNSFHPDIEANLEKPKRDSLVRLTEDGELEEVWGEDDEDPLDVLSQ